MRPRMAGKLDANQTTNPKLSLPLRGKGVAITDQLKEIHERKDRMEMCYYQQKDIGQQETLKILAEEARFVNEADRAAKFSQEIAMWQKAHQEMKAKNESGVFGEAVRVQARTDHSLILDKKQKEPLITKAYNAFR